jgi:hypothetical protein
MPDKRPDSEYAHIEHRKVIVDLQFNNARGGHHQRGQQDDFQQAVVKAVRRELQRTRRA